MTTYYLSNTASNGYIVGNDSNSGLTKSLPFLTVGKALDVYTTADIITINDGAYLSTDGADGTPYPIIGKPVTIQAETEGGATITTTSAYALYINPFASGTFTVNGLVLDADGEFTGVAVNNTAFGIELVFSNTAINNFTLRGFGSNETDPTSIIFSDVSMTTVSNRNDVEVFSSGNIASGDITIDGLTLDITQGAGAGAMNGLKFVSTTGTGSTILISNVTGTINGNGLGSQIAPGFISLDDFTGYEISDIDINFTGLQGTYGINILTDSINGSIHDVDLSMDWQGGYGILSLAENTTIYNCTIANANTNQGVTPHGIVIGTDSPGAAVIAVGEAYNNIVSGFSPAYHMVNTGSDVIFHGNYAYANYGNYVLYSKGAVGSKFYQNTVYSSTGFNGNAFGMQTFDPAGTPVHSTNVEYKNNICYNSSVNPIFLFTDANQTGIFEKNLYYATETLRADSWQYAGTDYGDFTTYQAAVEVTAVYDDPKLLLSGELKVGSPGINTGVSIASLIGVIDIWGNVTDSTPNIGAYQGPGEGIYSNILGLQCKKLGINNRQVLGLGCGF